MKIYLLWFDEWEANYVLGVFETKEQAEHWKSYFIVNPGDCSPEMSFYKEKEDDWEDRFRIEERELNSLDSDIKINNLKYLEFCETNKAKELK